MTMRPTNFSLSLLTDKLKLVEHSQQLSNSDSFS